MKGNAMEKIRILTDSGSDFCPPYPKNLTVMPLTIHFGTEEYRDGQTIDHKTFYEKLISGAGLPTTREFVGHKDENMTKKYIDHRPSKIDRLQQQYFSENDL